MTEKYEKEQIKVDVVIIGAGPAGMTAAQYASRANLKTVIIEKGVHGGELNNTADVENYPGFSKISGPELAQKFYDSSMVFGAEHVYGDVSKIEVKDGIKLVHTSDKVFETLTVILATGAYHRELDVEGEKRLSGQGVSYCAVCDGFFFRNRDIVVVGGGDSAVEEGTYLTQFANKVTIIHRRDELRAQKILQERAFKNPKVDFVWDSVVEEIEGDHAVNSVRIRNLKTEEIEDLSTNGVFIYVGIIPNSQLLADLGVTDEEGWVLTKENMETDQAGIFAVGDVRKKHLRQIATAVGDGAIAGQAAYDYIQGL